MKRIIKTIGLLVFLMGSFTSCDEEYKPDLKSPHTIKINIKGSVCAKPFGEGVNNIPVEIWFAKNNEWSLERLVVASGKTNKNGNFNFNVNIDTTFFDEFHLCVEVKQTTNYITRLNKSDKNFFHYYEDIFKNIDLFVYKKAVLTINLDRQTDFKGNFEVAYSYDEGNRNGTFINTSTITQRYTLQYVTAADMYTIIQCNKSTLEVGEDVYIDSLICKQNEDNIINVKF